MDVNALHVGCNMFRSAGSFVGTNGSVVRKSTTLGAGPLTVTMSANLVSGAAGAGPFAPRGVDNLDAIATEGYCVGVDNATFSTLMFRRVSNPGSATPTIPANTSVTVPTTSLSLLSASATSGTTAAVTASNTVTWNGSLPVSGSVTVTTGALIKPGTAGTSITDQGTISFDGDGNGTNEATATTDDPHLPGDLRHDRVPRRLGQRDPGSGHDRLRRPRPGPGRGRARRLPQGVAGLRPEA